MQFMKFEEKLNEFVNIKTLEKFSGKSCVSFSNNTETAPWFSRNKEIIFNLKNDISKEIEKQYNEYLLAKEEEERQRLQAIENRKIMFDSLCQKFYEIADLNKYKENSEHMINDVTSGKWFLANKERILESKEIICQNIKLEYMEFLKKEKRDNALEYKKRLYEFYLEKSLNKFNTFETLRFRDGSFKNKWFFENKTLIFNSYDDVSVAVKKQYEVYLNNLDLKEEFVKHPNLEKYDIDGNVRFNSGALMCFFFQSNYDDISSSHNKIDCIIMGDYYKYLHIKNLYVDEDEKDLVKKMH